MKIATALSHGHGFFADAGREGRRSSGVHIIYMFYIVFFQPFQHPKVSLRIPSGATLTLPFRVRPTQEELHGMKTLRVGRKADQKMVFLVRVSFWSNDEQVCFQSDILIWKRSHILPHFTTFPSKRSPSLSVLRLQTTLTFSIDGVDSPSSELTESEAQWFPCKYV